MSVKAWQSTTLPPTLPDPDSEQALEAVKDRQAYELKRKASPDDEGHVRLQCQAAGSCSTVKCQLKPKSETGNSAKPRIHVPVEIVDHPPSICRQQSVVFPPDAGAKYLQPLTYQSDEWRRKYKMLRSTIEGANGYAKDAGFENMHDARRRRMRGTAMQTVLVALQLFGSNLRKIDGFVRDLRLTLERNQRASGARPRRRPNGCHPGIPSYTGGCFAVKRPAVQIRRM